MKDLNGKEISVGDNVVVSFFYPDNARLYCGSVLNVLENGVTIIGKDEALTTVFESSMILKLN